MKPPDPDHVGSFVPAVKPSRIDGIWLGTVHATGQDLRVQLTIKSDIAGREFCSFDCIEFRDFGLDCANTLFSDEEFSFDVPIISGRWSGKVSADGQTLSGEWKQCGDSVNLELSRQSFALGPPAIDYEPALPPVDVAGLKVSSLGLLGQAGCRKASQSALFV